MMKQEAKEAYRDCASYTLDSIEEAIKDLEREIGAVPVLDDTIKARIAELKQCKKAIEKDLEEEW